MEGNKHPRPTQDEILKILRATALRQLRTTDEGKALTRALQSSLSQTALFYNETENETLVTALIDCIVNNQAGIVNTWLEIAIEGE